MFEVTARRSEFANGDRLGTRSIIRFSDAYQRRRGSVPGASFAKDQVRRQWVRQSVADLLNRMGGSIENEVANFGMTGVVRNVVQRLVARRVWLNHVAQLI
jgi:hypothetical protein